VSEDIILKEGAAGGHMKHPFDLPKIKSGKDLVDYFEKAASWLEENPGSLKLDGANTSFKIIGEPGERKFAVDRGSMKPADLAGITADNVKDRFPREGHGMHTAIPLQLKVLDDAFAELGGLEKAAEKNKVLKMMIEDPSFYLNAEFVQRDEEGRSPNVVQYDHDFIALHGLKQFYEKFNRQQEKVRTGAERPEDVAASEPGGDITGEDISSAIREIVSIADKEARKYNFRVHGDIPTQKAANTEKIDFSAALSTPVTIWEDSEGEKITKSLSQWLSEVSNPGYEQVVLSDGRKLHALHKDLYLNVLSAAAPLDQIIEDPSQRQKARDGAIIMHATRLLGQQIKNGLEADYDIFGSLQDEEGAIIRNPEINGITKAVKFTGDFIVQGMSGLIKQKMAAEKEPSLTEDAKGKVADTAVVPGAFKPPHLGHIKMIKHYADLADVVKVYISKKALEPGDEKRSNPTDIKFTPEMSQKIFRLLADREGLDNVVFLIGEKPTPVAQSYYYIEELAEPGEKVLLGASKKDDDAALRFKSQENVQSHAKEGVVAVDPIEYASPVISDEEGLSYSATRLRQALKDNDTEALVTFIPEDLIDDVLEILNTKNPEEEGNEDPTSEYSLDEISASGTGAISGSPGVRDGLPENYFIKREDLMKEMQLRETIRKVLSKAYFEKNKTRILEEQKLRKVIRKFITEAREADEVVYSNTGINKLRDLLRRIIPVIQDDYRDLTTSIEQRESFTKHLLIGIQNLLGISDLSKGVEKLSLQEGIEEDIEVEIGRQDEDPGIMDIGLGGEELVDVPDDVEEEEELSDEEKLVSSSDEMPTDPNILTGMRAAARTLKKVQTQIKDMYEEISNPEDEQAFAEYILPNIKAHIDDFEVDISDASPEPEITSPIGSVEIEDEETIEDQFELSEEVLRSIANFVFV
jgi:hypothetical protein